MFQQYYCNVPLTSSFTPLKSIIRQSVMIFDLTWNGVVNRKIGVQNVWDTTWYQCIQRIQCRHNNIVYYITFQVKCLTLKGVTRIAHNTEKNLDINYVETFRIAPQKNRLSVYRSFTPYLLLSNPKW